MKATLALALAVLFAAAPASPLTNEDIVRLVVGGTPQAEILETIAARPAAFDLSDDMVAELKLAGVPDAVLAAMRARQTETAPAPAPERPRRGMVKLEVALSGPETLTAPKRASGALVENLRLPAADDARAVHDLAIFLACATPEHVPDLWRSKTPLGRDLEGTPRHEMLRFQAGDTADGAKPALKLPATIDAEVDDIEAHDLVLGIAARIGDRWRVLALARRPKVKSEAGAPLRLIGKITPGGAPFAFRVELAPQRASDTSLETPASSIVTP